MEAQAPAGTRPRGLRGLLARPAVAILVAALLASGLRLWDLGNPPERIFDEFYYTKSACIFLGWSPERCSIDSEDEKYWYRERFDTGAWVHPPAGKWAIALGELAFGFDASDGLSERDAFAMRVPGAIAGVLTVVVVAALAQVLFGSALWTFLAGALLAIEGLSIVQSRTAMLDVFVTLWIALAFLLAVLDRRWILRRSPTPSVAVLGPGEIWLPAQPDLPSPLWRPYRFLAGLALGLAVATKWSALAAIVGVGALAFAWECVRRRQAGDWRWFAHALGREGLGIVLAFVVVPALAYAASYAGWFVHFGGSLREWAALQASIASYHWSLVPVGDDGKPIHPYLSAAWWWLVLARPVLYYAEYLPAGARRVIYANGNPAVFWGAFLSIPTSILVWLRAREWQAGVAVVGFAALYLPWFLVSRPQFLFYALPVVPFLVLAMVVMLRELTLRGYTPLAVGLVVVAVGLTVLFWPTYVAQELDANAWTLRAWFPGWT
ncbi:MAG: phospholipid carrier-dependent glycosyltransferase [Actinomycetota bacterium]